MEEGGGEHEARQGKARQGNNEPARPVYVTKEGG
jgi:hypothetical protein